jgi:DNA-binding response OmpR family regulator
MRRTVLLVEDDRTLRETTTAFLAGENFKVLAAADGEAGLASALREKVDLILLDIILPGIGGFEICRRLREQGCRTPIIILTGKKKDETDKVLGLEIGADDYVVKPFGQRELLARIHAVLRRALGERKPVDEYAFGDVRVDFKKKIASKAGRPLTLTAKEYGLLQLLVAHEGEVVSREKILNEAWGYEKFPTTRTVDTFIHSLRRKIEKNPARPVHLLTVPWMGYKFQK